MRAMGARELGYRGMQSLRAKLERAGVGRLKPLPADAADNQLEPGLVVTEALRGGAKLRVRARP